jgi:hypothetical protein
LLRIVVLILSFFCPGANSRVVCKPSRTACEPFHAKHALGRRGREFARKGIPADKLKLSDCY